MLTRPYVGLKPTHPDSAAGMRTLPQVSVPNEPAQLPATTDAPDPPDEPPGIRVWSCGLRVGPKCALFVVPPQANSCVACLPSRTAPAARSRAATVLSPPAGVPANVGEPAVVGTPATS